MSAKKDALKFLLKRLANKTGATPEEIPMSISEPRLMEDLRRGLAPMIPGGPYKRGEASRLDIKLPIQTKTKTKTQKELSATEKRIQEEKVLDKILENRLATIKRQQVESGDDVIDIETGRFLEDSEIEPTQTIIKSIGELSPTTLTRSKAVDLKGPKAKELVKTMNRLEKSEIRQNKLLSDIAKTKQNADKESDFKKVEMLTKSLNEEINNKQNKIDRAALRKYFKEKKIVEGKTPVKQPRDEESQLPNIVGQASDPTSPVVKLDIQADPGFAPKTDQEFFDSRVQDYLDQGDDLKTARGRASDDIQERNLSDYTVDQLRDLMGEGFVESEVKKKAGGQVGKPKRKIKKSVRGNDLVAMMYD
jgi:hypothetical protein